MEIRAETQDRNLEVGIEADRGSTTSWFCIHDLLSLLSYTTQIHLPRGGTTHSCQLIKKMLPRHAHRN